MSTLEVKKTHPLLNALGVDEDQAWGQKSYRDYRRGFRIGPSDSPLLGPPPSWAPGLLVVFMGCR